MTSSASKKARRKKRMARKQQRYAGFEQRLYQKFPDLLPQNSIVIEPSGEVKMSDVLMQFVAEDVESADSKERYEALLTFAVLAWNASFLPRRKQKRMIRQALRAGFTLEYSDMRADMKSFIEKLIARKHEHFSAYSRRIVSFEIVDLDAGGFFLNVASTLEM